MRTLLISFITLFLTSYNSKGQDSLKKKACSDSIYKIVKAQIPGQNFDSTIKVDNVKAGFKLITTDPSYKIDKFFIVFDYGENLIELQSTGDKIIPDKTEYGKYLNEIKVGSLLTVEGIIVTNNNNCYKLSPLIFHITD